MASVDVGELRHRASELLRLVAEGESIEITDRGRPVAMLTPVRQERQARLSPAAHHPQREWDLADLPEPLTLLAGCESPSSVLARLRQDER